MKLDDYMNYLEKIRRDHGNLDVETDSIDGRKVASAPVVRNRLVLYDTLKKQRFWGGDYPPENRGEKVVQV